MCFVNVTCLLNFSSNRQFSLGICHNAVEVLKQLFAVFQRSKCFQNFFSFFLVNRLKEPFAGLGLFSGTIETRRPTYNIATLALTIAYIFTFFLISMSSLMEAEVGIMFLWIYIDINVCDFILVGVQRCNHHFVGGSGRKCCSSACLNSVETGFPTGIHNVVTTILCWLDIPKGCTVFFEIFGSTPYGFYCASAKVRAQIFIWIDSLFLLLIVSYNLVIFQSCANIVIAFLKSDGDNGWPDSIVLSFDGIAQCFDFVNR